MELQFSFCLPDHERIYARLVGMQSISHGFQRLRITHTAISPTCYCDVRSRSYHWALSGSATMRSEPRKKAHKPEREYQQSHVRHQRQGQRGDAARLRWS